MMRTTQTSLIIILTMLFMFELTLSACAVELIDDIIDERGVTYCSETTAVHDTSTGTASSSGDTTLV